MRSRFIARMTDIAFQASPPRGVGMLRLVSPSAISRYGFAPHRLDDRLEIEFRRRQRSLSQRELASLVGRSQGQLANAIAVTIRLSSAVVNRLRDVLLA